MYINKSLKKIKKVGLISEGEYVIPVFISRVVAMPLISGGRDRWISMSSKLLVDGASSMTVKTTQRNLVLANQKPTTGYNVLQSY